MQNLTVTFDSNILGNIVYEQKRVNDLTYDTLYKLII